MRTCAPVRPLTDSQQASAALPANIEMALKIARRIARRCPREYETCCSAAMVGLCYAARDFDPAGGSTWKSYAQVRIAGTILDTMRDLMPAGFRRSTNAARRSGVAMPRTEMLSDRVPEADAGGQVKLKTLADTIAAEELPVGWEIEFEDEIAAIARTLPPQHAEAVRLYYTRCEAIQRQGVARSLRLSASRVSQLIIESVRLLRNEPKPFLDDRRSRNRRKS